MEEHAALDTRSSSLISNFSDLSYIVSGFIWDKFARDQQPDNSNAFRKTSVTSKTSSLEIKDAVDDPLGAPASVLNPLYDDNSSTGETSETFTVISLADGKSKVKEKDERDLCCATLNVCCDCSWLDNADELYAAVTPQPYISRKTLFIFRLSGAILCTYAIIMNLIFFNKKGHYFSFLTNWAAVSSVIHFSLGSYASYQTWKDRGGSLPIGLLRTLLVTIEIALPIGFIVFGLYWVLATVFNTISTVPMVAYVNIQDHTLAYSLGLIDYAITRSRFLGRHFIFPIFLVTLYLPVNYLYEVHSGPVYAGAITWQDGAFVIILCIGGNLIILFIYAVFYLHGKKYRKEFVRRRGPSKHISMRSAEIPLRGHDTPLGNIRFSSSLAGR
mmetsp:Transcript_14032/g.16298  ORF Transcript_14032/g.16298 Transcript_14032/m.16298 type:complete len:386 (+) Transcript_14032:274-1431(+)